MFSRFDGLGTVAVERNDDVAGTQHLRHDDADVVDVALLRA